MMHNETACPDCKGTKQYIGFNEISECLTCKDLPSKESKEVLAKFNAKIVYDKPLTK